MEQPFRTATGRMATRAPLAAATIRRGYCSDRSADTEALLADERTRGAGNTPATEAGKHSGNSGCIANSFKRTAQYEYMKNLEQRLASVEMQNRANQQTELAYQERDKEHERQIQQLTALLHTERVARQTLSEQYVLQQERLQALSHEWEAQRFSRKQSSPDLPTS